MIHLKHIPDNTPLDLSASVGPVTVNESLIWGNTQISALTVMGGRMEILPVNAPGSVPQHDGTYALDLSAVDLAETRTFTTPEGQQVTLDILAPSQAAKFSAGVYYMLETNPANGDIVIEPGRRHRKVYITGGSHAYTKAKIAAEVGIAETAVTLTWLKANPIWGGSPEKALDEVQGMALWEDITKGAVPANKKVSHWLLLERGYSYGATGKHWWQSKIEGESQLHPIAVMAYGTGAAPILTHPIVTFDSEKSAVVGLDVSKDCRVLYGKWMMFADISSAPGANETSYTFGRGAATMYRVLCADAHKLKPAGDGTFWGGHANRTQGMYVSDSTSILVMDSMFDHCGWKDGFSSETGSYAVNQNHPTSMYSQNIYVHDGKRDATIDGCLTARPSSQGAQLRCGGMISDTLFLDNQASGNDLGGDYSGKGPVGHWGLFLRNVITSASYLLDPKDAGPRGARNWGFTFQNQDGSVVDSIVCHMSNPNDPVETAEKSSRGFSIRNRSARGSRFDNHISFNWDNTDRNVEGLSPAALNAATIQNFAATKLPQGTAPTIKNFMNWMKATLTPRQRQVMIREMLDYFRAPYDPKLEMSAIKRVNAQTCIFKPDNRGEGFRWDNPLNWTTRDKAGSVAGDSADLYGNFVRYGRFTLTVGSLRFRGGSLDVTSGKLTAQAHADAAKVTVRESGQYFAPANAHGDYVVSGGRLVLGGAADAGIAVSGEAECLFGPNLTVPAGKSLSLMGGDCWAGWDGTGTANLTVAGTLEFSALLGKAPMLQRFKRRGDNPEPTVAVTVTLAAGSTVTVDTADLVAGTYDLTGPGVTVVNQGAVLPAGVAVTGGKLVLTV